MIEFSEPLYNLLTTVHIYHYLIHCHLLLDTHSPTELLYPSVLQTVSLI
jgi:hypothetical protein